MRGTKKLLVDRRAHIILGSQVAGGQLDGVGRHIDIGDLAQNMADAVEPCPLFVIRIDGKPGRFGNVGVGKHGVLRFGILDPAIAGFQIHRAEFPAPSRIRQAGLKAPLLLVVTDGKPIFQQNDA